jgi:hypothetical protein
MSRASGIAAATSQTAKWTNALTADLDFAFVLAGCREVISELHSKPRFRRAAERLG